MPGDVSTGDGAPGHGVPGDMLPGGMLPGDVSPGDATPGDVVTGGGVPGGVLPGDVVTGQAALGGKRPRVALLGEPGRAGGLVNAIAARLADGGADVLVVAPDDALPSDLDAGVECCVVDATAKAAAALALDAALPPASPLVTICHATTATGTAALVSSPGRVTGFALPPPVGDRVIVECACAMQTTESGAAAAASFWTAVGLEPAWVGDGAGLVTPRIIACLANEALFALSESVASADDIDLAMRLGTRYPRGPLEWAAMLGFDQVLAIMDALAAEHGEDRYRAAPLLRRLVAANADEVG
ncbi:MAG: 3-hydroxyacyl-CoA dehydrogenase family protein [Anaerolineae bacterium]